MYLIATNESLVLNNNRFFRVYPGSAEGKAGADRVWIHLIGEGKLLNDVLLQKTKEREQKGDKCGAETAETAETAKIFHLTESSILEWPLCPKQSSSPRR